jgi:aerobic-type carbon monoxide dehydrogenase small subunit (CoxS/CutS family)
MSKRARLRCRINGRSFDREIDARLLLVELVRETESLKGTRIGCLTGDCGACTLKLDGNVVKSCLVLALSVDGREVVTIEGASDLAEIQDAFVSENGFQCGFCTTGMVMTAGELLRVNPDPTEAEIRRAISGNLCRCTGYDDIVAAIARASEIIRSKPKLPSFGGLSGG